MEEGKQEVREAMIKEEEKSGTHLGMVSVIVKKNEAPNGGGCKKMKTRGIWITGNMGKMVASLPIVHEKCGVCRDGHRKTSQGRKINQRWRMVEWKRSGKPPTGKVVQEDDEGGGGAAAQQGGEEGLEVCSRCSKSHRGKSRQRRPQAHFKWCICGDRSQPGSRCGQKDPSCPHREMIEGSLRRG